MIVTVFGGTGFLGHRIANALLGKGWTVRIAARHPEKFRPSADHSGSIEFAQCDVRDKTSIEAALQGSDAAANAVSLYVEKGDATFRNIHVEGARDVAETARRNGISRLVHISGIGSDANAKSDYIRRRGQGEDAVREALASAMIFRPSVMFGEDDNFINMLASLSGKMPVLPLFGDGSTRLQPVSADDVAEAAANALDDAARAGKIYDLGGAEIWTYRDLCKAVMDAAGHKRLLVPVPFFVWDMIAASAGILPNPPITSGQVALMKRDNVASPDRPGLEELGVTPASVKPLLERIAAKS